MTLDEYLTAQGLTTSAFARQLGLWHGTVSKWRRRATVPAPEAMRAIFDATGGAVQPNDWVLPTPMPAAPAELAEAAQ